MQSTCMQYLWQKLCCSHSVFKTDIRSWTSIKESAWWEEYIDKNTELRKQAKSEDFFRSMNNSFLGKTMENARKHRDIESVTANKRRGQLVSELNYHTTKWFSKIG